MLAFSKCKNYCYIHDSVFRRTWNVKIFPSVHFGRVSIWCTYVLHLFHNSICVVVFLQISPTRYTILVNIFISLLYMFRISMCPLWGGNYCIYTTLVLSVCIGAVWSGGQTAPIQIDKHQCRIDTVISSLLWVHRCPKHVQKWNKYINQNCAPSCTY